MGDLELTASADFHCEDLGGVEIGRDVALIDDPFAVWREGRLPALRDKANGTGGADNNGADNTPKAGQQ